MMKHCVSCLIYYNSPCLHPSPPLQIFRKHSFQILLGVTVVLRESEGNGYAKFREVNMENGELQ